MKEILCFKQTAGSQDGYFGYDSIEEYRPTSLKLACVKLSLSGYSDDWRVTYTKTDNYVLIYDDDNFKEMLDVDAMSEQEAKLYEQAYDQYYDKRWDDMPHVKIKIEDWELLEKKWDLLYKQWPNYAVFYLDDSQEFAEVDLVFKDELSKEDIQLLKYNNQKRLKYLNAKKLYQKNHPDYSEVWRGPQDDEYEADIMKYYDSEE